jgi:hypothetical protein
MLKKKRFAKNAGCTFGYDSIARCKPILFEDNLRIKNPDIVSGLKKQAL